MSLGFRWLMILIVLAGIWHDAGLATSAALLVVAVVLEWQVISVRHELEILHELVDKRYRG